MAHPTELWSEFWLALQNYGVSSGWPYTFTELWSEFWLTLQNYGVSSG